jgi:hypothetical protein
MELIKRLWAWVVRVFRRDRWREIRVTPGPRHGGFLKVEQTEEAKRIMQQTKEMDIGRVLVSLGMVGERELLMARAQKLNLGFVDLNRVIVSADAIASVPKRMAKHHSVMPLKKDGNTLWIAMSNDTNIAALDDVKMARRLPGDPRARRAGRHRGRHQEVLRRAGKQKETKRALKPA